MNSPNGKGGSGFANTVGGRAWQLLEATAVGDAIGATTEFLDVVKAVNAVARHRGGG